MVFTAIPAAHISNHEALVGGKWSGMETKMWQEAGVFGTEKGGQRPVYQCKYPQVFETSVNWEPQNTHMQKSPSEANQGSYANRPTSQTTSASDTQACLRALRRNSSPTAPRAGWTRNRQMVHSSGWLCGDHRHELEQGKNVWFSYWKSSAGFLNVNVLNQTWEVDGGRAFGWFVWWKTGRVSKGRTYWNQ